MDQDVTINQINKIGRQFLCTFPLINFNWQNILNTFLSEELQEYLINKTINLPLVLRYPVQINYQKSFLKHILDKLETIQAATTTSTEETVIYDALYSAYGRLVAVGTSSTENYKHYSLETGNKVMITLKESNSLISDGTTGLRTWQASLVLSEWIVQNKDIFSNQNVLELGSGVGLTGLVLSKLSRLNTIYLTDCHEAVLETLCENVKLNIEEMSSAKKCSKGRKSYPEWNELRNRCLYTHNNSTTLSILDLPWENVTPNICTELGIINRVIAADIVYDNDLFKPLVFAMKCLKECCRVEEFIFACTERNPETLDEFLELMTCTFKKIEQLEVPPQNNFFWPTDTPIKIYRFKD